MTNVICDLIYQEIAKRFSQEPLSIDGLEFSDNFAEIIEKLIILHIRMWKMEDAVSATTNDHMIAELKRKIDFIFKIKRPKLLAALNLLVDDYVSNHKSFKEENLKLYNQVTQ